jgi:putative peptidoglycan lipid II flippase
MIVSKALESIGLRRASPERPLTANWKIFRAVVVVGTCSVIARLAATAKELGVAGWFGRGDALDALLIAMILPATITGLVAGSFNSALIPPYIQTRENHGHEAAQRLFSSVQVVSLLLLIGASILLAVAAPYYLPLLGSGFSVAKLLLTRQLFYIVLPIVVLNGAITIWSSVLNAGEKFALPALTPALTPLVTLLILFLLGRTWGIFALATGTVAGTVLEASLLLQVMRSHGLRLRLRWYGLSPELRLVFRQYAQMVTGTLVLTVSLIIDQSMAAMLKSGSVAALSYGYKIVGVIVALTSAALSTAVLPYFSKMIARKDWNGCRRTLKVYSLLVLSATIPLTLGLIAGSRPLVRLLYQRGAFTETDTVAVSAVQIFFALLIPFAAWGTLFVRFLSSLYRSDLLAYGAVISICLNVFLNIVFMRRFGVAGIALSTSVVCLFSFLFLGFWTFELLHREERAGGRS